METREQNEHHLFGHHRKPERATTGDVAAILAMMQGHYSQLLQHLHDLHWNDVLHSGVLTLDTRGQASITLAVPFASLAVVNLGTSTVTIATGGLAGSAPGAGAGIHQLGPGKGATFAMRDNAVSFYGTAGQQLDVQIFSKIQPPNFGSASEFTDANGADRVSLYAQSTNPGDTAVRTSSGAISANGSRLAVSTGIFPLQVLGNAAAPIASGGIDFTGPVNSVSLQYWCPVAPTSLTIALEGSLDGNHWVQLATSSNIAGDLIASTGKPVRFARANLTAIAGGGTVTAQIGGA